MTMTRAAPRNFAHCAVSWPTGPAACARAHSLTFLRLPIPLACQQWRNYAWYETSCVQAQPIAQQLDQHVQAAPGLTVTRIVESVSASTTRYQDGSPCLSLHLLVRPLDFLYSLARFYSQAPHQGAIPCLTKTETQHPVAQALYFLFSLIRL